MKWLIFVLKKNKFNHSSHEIGTNRKAIVASDWRRRVNISAEEWVLVLEVGAEEVTV